MWRMSTGSATAWWCVGKQCMLPVYQSYTCCRRYVLHADAPPATWCSTCSATSSRSVGMRPAPRLQASHPPRAPPVNPWCATTRGRRWCPLPTLCPYTNTGLGAHHVLQRAFLWDHHCGGRGRSTSRPGCPLTAGCPQRAQRLRRCRTAQSDRQPRCGASPTAAHNSRACSERQGVCVLLVVHALCTQRCFFVGSRRQATIGGGVRGGGGRRPPT